MRPLALFFFDSEDSRCQTGLGVHVAEMLTHCGETNGRLIYVDNFIWSANDIPMSLDRNEVPHPSFTSTALSSFFRHFTHTLFYLLKEIHVRSKADLVLIPPETNSLCMTETTSSKLDTCLKKSVFLLVFFF